MSSSTGEHVNTDVITDVYTGYLEKIVGETILLHAPKLRVSDC